MNACILAQIVYIKGDIELRTKEDYRNHIHHLFMCMEVVVYLNKRYDYNNDSTTGIDKHLVWWMGEVDSVYRSGSISVVEDLIKKLYPNRHEHNPESLLYQKEQWKKEDKEKRNKPILKFIKDMLKK
jgi:hypothetical protein